MPQLTQVIDALWHCLCPSFRQFSQTSLVLARSLSWNRQCQSMCFTRPKKHRWRTDIYLCKQQKKFHTSNARSARVLTKRRDGSMKGQKSLIGHLRLKTTEEAYEELSRASKGGDFPRTEAIVRYLVEERLEPPNPHLYRALLAALTDHQHGCPTEVKRLLQEMREESLLPDTLTYHAILKVLAIHPDYMFRNQILEELEQRWFSLNESGHWDVILGLIRDRQVERALDKLERNRSGGMQVPTYLYNIMVYILCDLEEFEEILKIIQYRVAAGEKKISGTMWAHILDTASRNLHHEATLYVWRERVDSNYLNPSSGVCINVLNTAARYGDYRLATKVLQVLGRRSSTLQLYHYEPLLEAYLNAGDLRTALTLLTTMVASGNSSIHPEEATTRPIFTCIRSSPSLTKQALEILHDLKNQGRLNPPVAVNCIIEAFIDQKNLESAIETYKLLHTLCPPEFKPTTQTFNILLRGCSKFSRKDLAQFLFEEMQGLGVEPDALTFDRLILTCMDGGGNAEEGDDRSEILNDAWDYLKHMDGKGWWPRRGTLVALAKRAVEEGDERVFWLIEEMERRKLDVGGLGRWVGETWKGESAKVVKIERVSQGGQENAEEAIVKS